MEGGARADCQVCRRILVDESVLAGYVFTGTGKASAPAVGGATPRAPPQRIPLARRELLRFCLDKTFHILLTPETAQGDQRDRFLDTLIGLRPAELPHILRHCKAMKEWSARLGADHPCPMCLEPVGERDACQGDCVPKPHRCHIGCWNYQPEHVKPFCRVCGQQSLGETELLAVEALFGYRGLEGNVDAFPPAGRKIIERFVLGAVPHRELWRWCDAPYTQEAFGQTPLDDEM